MKETFLGVLKLKKWISGFQKCKNWHLFHNFITRNKDIQENFQAWPVLRDKLPQVVKIQELKNTFEIFLIFKFLQALSHISSIIKI